MATEYYVDQEHGVQIINESNVRSDAVIRAVQDDPQIASLTRWMVNTQGKYRRARGGASMVDRDRYVTPSNVYDQMRVAMDAVESDDTVGGWMETTENLMFEDVGFECDEPYEQDIWNQVAENLELEERMREAYRGLATCSQVYPMIWWGSDSFKVQSARTPGGKAAKKSFDNLKVPVGITFLDPLKVLPVGNLMFNQEGLAYIADITEVDQLDAAAVGDPAADDVAKRMITRKYIPDNRERRLFGEYGIDPGRLYLMNPRNVFRIAATRMQHQRFAPVRMKPVLPLLDMKHQLREMDRAFLVGGLNFILVVTQGSEKNPGTAAEIAKLGMAVRTLGRVPLLIGDARLEVKIVAPPQEHTLQNEKYQTLNAPIVAYLYRMVMISHGGAKGGDDQIKAAKIVGRGLQAVRKRIGKKFMRDIFKRMWTENDLLTEPAKMKYWPRRIELDFDPAIAQLMLDIYDHRDISRDTMLSLVDVDQAEEAAKKRFEKEVYDDDFQTIVPFTSPNAGGGGGSGGGGGGAGGDGGAGGGGGGGTGDTPRRAGRKQGGNRNGGGAARPGSGQGKPDRTPGRTSSQRRAAAAEDDAPEVLEDDDDD